MVRNTVLKLIQQPNAGYIALSTNTEPRSLNSTCSLPATWGRFSLPQTTRDQTHPLEHPDSPQIKKYQSLSATCRFYTILIYFSYYSLFKIINNCNSYISHIIFGFPDPNWHSVRISQAVYFILIHTIQLYRLFTGGKQKIIHKLEAPDWEMQGTGISWTKNHSVTPREARSLL